MHAVADHRALRLEQRRVLRHGDDAGSHERAHRRGEPVREGRGGGGHGPDATPGEHGRHRGPPAGRSVETTDRATALRPCRSAALRRCGRGRDGRGCRHDRGIEHRHGARGPQALPDRRGGRRRPARDRPRPGARRDGRDHGPERLRQDHAAQLPVRARRRRRRRDRDRGRRAVGDVGPRAHRLPRPADGVRLPVLQPDAGPHGGRERRAAAARRPGRGRRGAPPRARGARARRAARTARGTCPRSCPAASASA